MKGKQSKHYLDEQISLKAALQIAADEADRKKEAEKDAPPQRDYFQEQEAIREKKRKEHIRRLQENREKRILREQDFLSPEDPIKPKLSDKTPKSFAQRYKVVSDGAEAQREK